MQGEYVFGCDQMILITQIAPAVCVITYFSGLTINKTCIIIREKRKRSFRMLIYLQMIETPEDRSKFEIIYSNKGDKIFPYFNITVKKVRNKTFSFV